MPIAVVAALLFCLLLATLSVFQVALIACAPLGRYAWGGAERVLPRPRRIASGVAVVLYVVFALLFLTAAGIVPAVLPSTAVTILAWVVVAYIALGTVMNALSRSRRERTVMTPVAAVLTLLGVLVLLA